jgi:hypothetical protein
MNVRNGSYVYFYFDEKQLGQFPVQNGERQETDCYIYQEFQLGFVGIFNS